jgi:hypothetical protein
MKQFVAVIFCSLSAFGQAAYGGAGRSSGATGFYASGNSSCAAPNFCAYAGADLVPSGAAPNFGALINNNATATDSSYLGHTNFDGTTFGNSALLSPITRLTDSVSAQGRTNVNFTAGMGGSGVFTLTNTNTSLVRIDQNSLGLVCRFYTSGANKGHCAAPPSGWGGTAPTSGIFITTGQLSGGSCTSNCPVNDFGANSFSLTDPTVLYTFGNDAYDISTATTVTPYTINASTGVYSVGSPLVDFQYGLPLGSNAPLWQANTSYPYGAYVTHTLTASEMASGTGVWTANTAYNLGDIVVSGGSGAGNCMYRVIAAGTSLATGTGPAFVTTPPCKNDIINEAVPSTVQWRGTNSTAQFVYQNTGAAGTSATSAFQWIATPATLATDGSMSSGSAVLTSSSNPFTNAQVGQTISVAGAGNSAGSAPLYSTILSYQNRGQVTLAIPAAATVSGTATIALTGHPDLMSSAAADSHEIVWTNVGPSYPITAGNQLWQATGGISRDTAYGGYTSRYGVAISTNSYGFAPTYSKYTADQGSGTWALEYDHTTNSYHLLNTLTGIWTDWSCSGGSGYNCAGGTITAATVGTMQAISNPLGIGQNCPFFVHNEKMSSNGLYIMIVSQADVYAACASLQNFLLWQTSPSGFNSISSLQFTFAGMNHWAIGTNKMVAFNSSGWGHTAGVFIGVYNANNAQGNNGTGTGYAPPFSVYLNPLASQSTAQTVPPGCYVTVGSIQSPDCNLSEILDSHLSWVGDPGSDTYPVCGTSFNYATLGPAFNAWQNMETCYQTYPTYPTGYAPPASYTLPSASVGNVWQFTHTFATGTSASFSTQFQISEYSQDANWLFWSSDWNCQNGSTTGSAPTVYPGSGTYVDMLAVTAVPANPTSVCGLPWAGSTTYVVGNLINPIEGTTGTGAVDDVFQAIYAGGPTGSTQPGPAIPNSYFSTATTPTSSSPGSTICDSASGASVNPSLPYSTSCPTGTVWQDIGPQTQRGDVFAVNLGNQH